MDFQYLTDLLKKQGEAFDSFKQRNDKRFIELEKKMNRPGRGVVPDDGVDFRGLEDNPEHTKAFKGFIRTGETSGLNEHQKAMNITTGADGGFAVPEQLDREVATVMRDNSPMRQICTVKPVGTSDYKKLVNVHGASSGWVGEDDTRPETNTPTLEEVTPFMGEVYANPQATQWSLDDVFFDVGQFIREEIATEFGEQEGAAFVAGDGVKKPKGFLDYTSAAQADGARAFGTLEHMVAASPTALDPDELITLIYKLKAGYRKNASWLMNGLTASKLRKLKDSEGNYLWRQGIREGEPNVLMGHKVTICEDMPDAASGATPIALGDWKKGYYIVDRISTLLRDPYTNKPYVGFYARKRVGGMLVDSNAIKLYQMA